MPILIFTHIEIGLVLRSKHFGTIYVMNFKPKVTIMKNYVFLIALFFLFSSFAPTSDADKAMGTLNGFYDAMADFNYTKIDDYCTTGFSVIDDGKYFKNIGEFVDVVRTYEGAEFDIKLVLQHSKFKAKTGLLIVMFDVDINMGEEKMHIKAIESYVMKKEGGQWLIHFIHSTPIEE